MNILSSIRSKLTVIFLINISAIFQIIWTWDIDNRDYRLLILIAGIDLLSTIILFRIGQSISRRLYRATAIASAIAEGDLDDPIVVKDHDEVSRLLGALSDVRTSILNNIRKVSTDKLALTAANAQLHFALLELKISTCFRPCR